MFEYLALWQVSCTSHVPLLQILIWYILICKLDYADYFGHALVSIPRDITLYIMNLLLFELTVSVENML